MANESKSDTELREVFDHFDGDNNGYIEYEEFLAILDALDFDPDPDMREMGFEIVDGNSNDKISFEEFVSWFRSQ